MQGVLGALCKAHQHRVVGLEKLPAEPFVIAVNHSLATYDIGLLLYRIWESEHRWVRGLGDHALFLTPGLGRFCKDIGIVEGDPGTARALLADGWDLVVAPGGMREALRSHRHRYELCWDRRRGFIRLVVESGAPLVLGACPRADDLYDVAPSGLTNAIYAKWRLPLPLGRGFGPTLLPRPIPLVHHVSEPIRPPPCPEDPVARERVIEEVHHEAVRRMEGLMEAALLDAMGLA